LTLSLEQEERRGADLLRNSFVNSNPQSACSTAVFDYSSQARLQIRRLESLNGLRQRYAMNCIMQISARNKITGTVVSVEKGAVASVVKVQVKDPFTITSMITKEAVDDRKLKKGDKLSVIVKSTQVIIAKD
jgi:molybdopterin-binding protein